MLSVNKHALQETTDPWMKHAKKITLSSYLWNVSLACSEYLALTVECVPAITCKMMLKAKQLWSECLCLWLSLK